MHQSDVYQITNYKLDLKFQSDALPSPPTKQSKMKSGYFSQKGRGIVLMDLGACVSCTRQNVLIFVQVFGKNGQIVGWRPHLDELAPSGKSCIRHNFEVGFVSLSLYHRLLIKFLPQYTKLTISVLKLTSNRHSAELT